MNPSFHRAGAAGRAALLVACLVAAALAAVWLTVRRGGGNDPETARRLVHETNVAVGLLENQSLAEAIPRLESLRAALPRDPLPARNLAIARVLEASAAGQTAPAAAIAAAARALATLERLEGETTAGLWLSWHLAVAQGDWPAAARRCAAIVARDPDDPAGWYHAWRASRGGASAGGGSHAAATADDAALERAVAAAPRNLWLAVEWLRAAAERLSRGPDASGAGTDAAASAAGIEARWEAIAPFAPALEAFGTAEPRRWLDEATAAVRAGEPGRAAGRLRALANVLAPQTEADRRPLEHHPLEFVSERLRSDWLARHGLAAATPTPSIPVALTSRGVLDAGPRVGGMRAVLLEDFDLDGGTDVLALADGGLSIWSRGERRGLEPPHWREIAAADLPAGTSGLLAADLDLDFDEARRAAAAARPATDPVATPAATRLRGCPAADLDLVVWGRAGVTCLENRLDARSGTRTLVEFPDSGLAAEGAVRTAAVADLDADGQLDLVTADDAGLRIWVRRRAGVFAAATDPGTLPPVDFRVEAIVPCDWDRDVDVDLLVVGAGGAGWVENLRHGQFRWQPFLAEVAAATAVDVIDADGDASWDLLVGGPGGIRLVPGKRSPDGAIRTGPAVAVAAAGPPGLATWDYDNDGVLDLAAWGDDGLTVSRGLPDNAFADATAVDSPRGLCGFDAADLDGDGDLDVALVSDAGVTIVENQGGNAHHWIAVDLEAQQIKGAEFAPSGRVNAHGLGGLLELKAGTSYQPRVVRRRTTHFGLGTRTEADAVRVTWLNGVPQNIVRPPADLLVCEQQILLGSCPYLYAWNGREFTFVTDLLWAAPLGLKRSDGELMPAREWEYVKIPGESLVPRDGRYEIRITEELWEAAYFDLVRLVVVDHPADVQIETNEKVGPAEIARFRIHTARRPRPPRAARDHRGRDVLPALAAADGVYLRPAAAKRRQGLLEEHAIELDLGPLAGPDRVTLFLRGWMFPTTVGLNLALARDASLGTPVPPSLSVPDGSGGWRTVLPFMGFPGGKTKTIAVDLAGLVPPDDPRVRIATSMEIAWDAAWITCGEEPEPIEVVEVCPESADLHPRGVSAIEQTDAAGPERFRYHDVITAPRWPAMLGGFTRYGMVTDLLAEQDDLLVVMGAGDETTLRFSVPPGPRPGWKRDFLLHSVGWDKDANLATVAGQTVEPLPFAAMRSYPPGPDDEPAASPARAAWIRDRQTRRQGDEYWRAIRPLPPLR